MKKRGLSSIVILVLLLSTAALSVLVNFADANPIAEPLVNVSSPQEGKTYASTQVLLNFTRIDDSLYASYFNFTSLYYSLDGGPKTPTNGTTVLSGLSIGSHRVVIYGDDYTADAIRFSVYVPSSIIQVSVILLAVAFVAAVLYVKRPAPLVRWYNKKYGGAKTDIFWVGLLGLGLGASLIIFGILFVLAQTDLEFGHSGSPIAIETAFAAVFFRLLFGYAGLKFMSAGVKHKPKLP